MCFTDIDLAGQVETRQSTSGLMIYLHGILVHWRARTETLIIQTTAAGEYRMEHLGRFKEDYEIQAKVKSG